MRRLTPVPSFAPRRRLLAAAVALLAPTAFAAGAAAQAPPLPPGDNSGSATAARLTWQPPAAIHEDQPALLGVSGELDGQARLQVALRTGLNASSCGAVPSGHASAIPVAASTTSGSAFGAAAHSAKVTATAGGHVRLCGWVIPSAGGVPLTVFEQVFAVVDAPASLTTQLPPLIRAGQSFQVTYTGTTSGTGRRVLAMGEPFVGQPCRDLRKGATGGRPLQSVLGVAKGTYSRKATLRFRSKNVGRMLLCLQVVETKDRVPEAEFAVVIDVAESLKCERAQTVTNLRKRDLQTIARRRSAAFSRLKAAKLKAAPLRKRYLQKKRASERRVNSARKQWRKSRSKAASRRLASVKRTEARRLKVARRPYAKAERSVKRNRSTWKRHARGVRLIQQTIDRTAPDLGKYCSRA